MFLCVCVMVGMASVPASATTTLSLIRLTIDAPKSGTVPATNATLPKNARSVVQKVEWSGKLDAGGAFMPRVEYKVTVTLGIKRGEDCVFSDKSINATVNGKQADDVLWYAKDRVEVIYTFPAYGVGDILTSCHITMEEPAVGAKPAASAHIPSTASTYVQSIK